MPNRILKESICTSDNLNELTAQEEVFFYRLIVNCDDFGIADARPNLLRAKCFPLRTDTVKEKDIEKWLSALVKANLIFLYEAEGKQYLKMTSWEKHQQIRAKKSKFPLPDSEDAHLISDDINGNHSRTDDSKCPRNPIQSESNTYTELNENIQQVYAFWNQQDIIVHQRLTPEMKNAITKIMKDLSPEQVMVSISRYKQVLDDEGFFFSYRWSLTDFLNRKNGIKDFLDDGAKWVSYQAHLKAQKQAKPPEKDPDEYRDRDPYDPLPRLPIINKEGEIIGWET